MTPRQAYEALYGASTAPAQEPKDDERRYTGGICPDHGPGETDKHARCVLCGQLTHLVDSLAHVMDRKRLINEAHAAALLEDAARDATAGDVVCWPPQFRRRRTA